MSLLWWFVRGSAPEADVRAEIWRLGVRHHGWPLEGAREELKAPDLAPERAALLRACVRRLQET